MTDIVAQNPEENKARPGLDFTHAAQREITAILEGEGAPSNLEDRMVADDPRFLTMPKKLASNLAGYQRSEHPKRFELFLRDCMDAYATFCHFASRQPDGVLINEKPVTPESGWQIDAQQTLFQNLMMNTLVKSGLAEKHNTDDGFKNRLLPAMARACELASRGGKQYAEEIRNSVGLSA